MKGSAGWPPYYCHQIFKKYSCPESYLDVNFGSSLALKLLQCVRVCKATGRRRVFSLTAVFTYAMMSISGEPSLTFPDQEKYNHLAAPEMTVGYKRRKGGSGRDPRGQTVACSHTRTGGCDANPSRLLRVNQGHVSRSQ